MSTPAWTTDLREHGFHTDRLDRPGALEASRQMTFGSNGEIVVLNRPGPLRIRTDVAGFVLEAQSGRLVRRVDWTAGRLPYVFGTPKGGYAAVTESGTVLYGPGLEELLARNPLSVEMMAPNGRRLGAFTKSNRKTALVFIDPESLQILSEEVRSDFVASISESRVASVVHEDRSQSSIVLVRATDGHAVRHRTDCGDVRPYFVSEEALVISGCGRFEVISIDGSPLFSGVANLGNDVFSSARDGKKFALTEGVFSEGGKHKLISERVTVFDLDLKKAAFSTKIDDLRGEDVGRSGAALSPDGTNLAVNSLGVVRLFRLGPVTKPDDDHRSGGGR